MDGRPNYIIIIEDNFGNEIVRRENVSAADLPLSIVDPLLIEGNYTIITLDSRGCLDMDGVSINSIDLQIVPDFDVPDDCVDGIIPQCVDIVNGVGPFDIRMVTDPSSPFIDLGASGRRYCFDFVPGGTYTVEVLDEGTGCVYQETVTVPEENSPVDVQLAIDNGNCNGEDVALEYAIIGAPGPFDIVIRNTDTGAIITDMTNTPVANDTFLVPQGPYSITVIDNTNFCTGADFIEATLNMPRVDVINNENANCNELGQLTVRGSGGTPFPPTGAGSLTDGSPYEYAFVPAGNSPASGDYGTATTIYLPGSPGGTSYDIWVRDSRGCEYMTSATIVQLDPDLPEPSIDVNNQCDGTIPVGGFQIELSMPANVVNPTFTLGGQTLTPAYDSSTPTVAVFNVGSGIGVYDVYVVDANGCDVSTTAEVYQILSASGGFSTDPTCEDADGTITITANGGSGDFSFELTGVDFNGNPITPIVQANDEVYNGFASTTTEQFVNIAPGTYEVEVTDNRVFGSGVNCTTTVSSIIAATPVQPVIADTGETNVSCNGAGDGSISVSLSTGTDADGIQEFNLYSATLPLTGAETPLSSNTSGSFDNLNPGTYVVEVVSNKLCTDVSQVTIDEPPVFEITSNDENLLCESGVNRLSTATISAQIVSPGNGGSYGYRLDPNDSYQSSPDFDIVDIGSDQTITIYAIDSNGCEDMVTITVYAPTDVIPTVSTLSALNCANPEQVEITATGTSDFTVITTGPSGTIIPNAVVTGGGTALIDLPQVGDYFFEVQDDSPNGCVYPLPRYTVNAPILPTATIAEAKPVSCFGTDDGELFIDVTDYSGNYNYRVYEASDISKSNPIATGSFDTANFSTTNLARITGLPGGNLYVEVIATDSPFCSNDSNVANIRTPNGPLQVDAISIGNVGCTNDTGEIEATGTGGWDILPYEYRLLLSTDAVQAILQR